jgi:DNA end-binding protein Ku
VDPVYFDGTYYLAPDKGGLKPYSLLTTALRNSKQCAVGRWVSRGKEHIVVIRPIGEGLAMHQLHFEAEVRAIKDLGVEVTKVSEAELKLADQLIRQLSAKKFDPHEFHDEFHRRVEAAIHRKVQGHEVSLAEAPAPGPKGNVIDLMQALKASLNARDASAAQLHERRGVKRATAPRKRSRQ